MNKMQNIKVEKLTFNVGAGKDQQVLEKGIKLIKHITGIDPVKCITRKRIPAWGVRPGLPIGCKLTVRDKTKIALIKRLLKAKNNKLSDNNFDQAGSIAFGILEYIDIPEVKYNPEIGLIGLQICITLERPGFRIKKRKLKQTKIPSKHAITREQAVEFMKKEFQINVGGEE